MLTVKQVMPHNPGRHIFRILSGYPPNGRHVQQEQECYHNDFKKFSRVHSSSISISTRTFFLACELFLSYSIRFPPHALISIRSGEIPWSTR